MGSSPATSEPDFPPLRRATSGLVGGVRAREGVVARRTWRRRGRELGAPRPLPGALGRRSRSVPTEDGDVGLPTGHFGPAWMMARRSTLADMAVPFRTTVADGRGAECGAPWIDCGQASALWNRRPTRPRPRRRRRGRRCPASPVGRLLGSSSSVCVASGRRQPANGRSPKRRELGRLQGSGGRSFGTGRTVGVSRPRTCEPGADHDPALSGRAVRWTFASGTVPAHGPVRSGALSPGRAVWYLGSMPAIPHRAAVKSTWVVLGRTSDGSGVARRRRATTGRHRARCGRLASRPRRRPPARLRSRRSPLRCPSCAVEQQCR